MVKRISATIFLLLFFGLFLWMAVPKFIGYAFYGWPDYTGATWMHKRLWFLLHMFFGTVVYVTGLIQFTPYVRNRYINFHRKLGKVYIFSSLVCITTLFIMVPEGTCSACRPSQFVVTSLWLLFVLLAYYFIRQRKIVHHQRMMIRSYICAAYFVTVRVIDEYAMGFFRFIKDESMVLLVSDISAWLVPLLFFEIYWRVKSFRTRTAIS